jgi:ankyrin repeat protein
LLKAGADINAVDYLGNNALMAASSNWKDESGQIIKCLLDTGIDVNIKNNKG